MRPDDNRADCLDASFKILLCFPCVASPPTSLLYEGQTDFILAKPTGVKEMLFGPGEEDDLLCSSRTNAPSASACAAAKREMDHLCVRAAGRARARARALRSRARRFALALLTNSLSRTRARFLADNPDKEVVARVGKGKKCCTCASYYQMKDRDGVMLARIKVSPTFCECLNLTCRKLTCQCCCCCRRTILSLPSQ